MSEGHKEICKVFASGKTCKFGKHCRYLHFRPPSLVSHSDRKSENGAVSSQARADSSRYQGFQFKGKSLEDKENEAVNRERSINSPTTSRSELLSHSEDDHNPRKNAGVTSGKGVCRFYLRTGTCRFGKNCRFLHSRDEQGVTDLPGPLLPNEENTPDIPSQTPTTQDHSGFIGKSTDSIAVGGATQKAARQNVVAGNKSFHRPQARRFGENLTLSITATDEEIKQFRDKEINQLMKRYPKAKKETRENEDSIQFVFHPSDPDWPYDVSSVELKIQFPNRYPADQMTLSVISDEVMPDTVRRCIQKKASGWITQRFQKMMDQGKAEIMCKPFQKWFDRNLEDIFTEGLKHYQMVLMARASGIELITSSELREKYKQQSDAESQDSNAEENAEVQGQSGDSASEASDEEDSEVNTTDDEKPKGPTDPARRGTEIRFHNLQLKESTGTLTAKKIFLIVRCGRCKENLELKTPPERLNCLECSRCHSQQYVTFRPSLAHQFSNVIGYLDLQDCSVFDMVLAECEFVAGCLKCNRDADFGNLHSGTSRDTWCHSCHAKMKVAVECVKFLQLQPSTVSTGTKGTHVEKPKAIKAVKDPSIVDGEPLPENGTCKHYKKSFRWFRFPCCGKAYQCDICHEEKENHEMLFANRMICGFCAKEQVYAGDRPCKRCNSFMTRKSTGHWEGGKGCRDKVKMSRGDAKKYSEQSKTVSRKAQNSKPSGAKNTKLRRV